MAVAFRRRSRKLFGDNETTGDDMPAICGDYCDSSPGVYHSGYCPLQCCTACPTICTFPFDYPNTPPAPPFAGLNLPSLPKEESNSLFPGIAITVPVLVLVACVFLLCLLRVCKLRSRMRATAAAQPQQPPQGRQERRPEEEIHSGLMVDHPIWYIRTVGLHSSVINAIVVCKFKELEMEEEGSAGCPVCLNRFRGDDTVRMLPKCKHAFHVMCIDTWLKSHNNCPVCRAVIELVDIEFPAGDGGSSRNGETPADARPDAEGLELRNNILKSENENE